MLSLTCEHEDTLTEGCTMQVSQKGKKKYQKRINQKNRQFQHLTQTAVSAPQTPCRSSAKRTSSQSSSSKSRQALPQPPIKSTRRRPGTHFNPHHTYSAVPAKRRLGWLPFFLLLFQGLLIRMRVAPAARHVTVGCPSTLFCCRILHIPLSRCAVSRYM